MAVIGSTVLNIWHKLKNANRTQVKVEKLFLKYILFVNFTKFVSVKKQFFFFFIFD